MYKPPLESQAQGISLFMSNVFITEF